MATSSQVETIAVPYDSGWRNKRMGAGPQRLLETVVVPLLRERRIPFDAAAPVEASEAFQAEIATAFDLNRTVAGRVAAAARNGSRPLVLSGNCNIAIGTTAGLPPDSRGVIWLDAHGDFNTPETTTSGFFDGMGLAVVAGLCWQAMAASVPGFRAIPGENILHIGGRDVTAPELRNMQSCGVQICGAGDLQTSGGRARLARALDGLRTRARRVYVHIDLDVISREEGEANGFSPPGGLAVETIAEILGMIADQCEVAAVGVASYDPACDHDGRIAAAAGRLLRVLLPSPG